MFDIVVAELGGISFGKRLRDQSLIELMFDVELQHNATRRRDQHGGTIPWLYSSKDPRDKVT